MPAQLSKQQLLTNLGTLDRVTLDKLWSYADLLLIPESDLLVNVTYKQMLDNVFANADVYFPQWTDRSHADFGRFLAELLCLFSEKDFWYLNAYANEGFLHQTRIYSNAYYKALELGYQPTLYQSAKCMVSLDFSAGSTLDIKPGDIRIEIAGIELANTDYFTVDNAGSQTVLTEFAVGRYQTKVESFNGRGITLSDKNIDLTSVNVNVDTVNWTRIETFSLSSPSDKVYFCLPDEDAAARVLFGDGTFGAVPTVGSNMTVLYRIGGGAMADIPASPVSVLESPVGRTIDLATQTTTLSGGANQESLASIKANAPVYFRTSGQIINESDAIAVLKMQPEVYNAQAILWANTLSFYVIPSAGGIADSTLLNLLRDRLKDQVVMGFDWQGATTSYVTLAPLEVTIYVTPGYTLEDVCSQVSALINAYTDPEAEAAYGRYFKFGALATHIISNVAGVNNLIVDSVAGVPNASIPNEEIIILPPQISEVVDIGSTFTTSLISGGIQYVANELTINAIFST
jgi:hypothetical protein